MFVIIGLALTILLSFLGAYWLNHICQEELPLAKKYFIQIINVSFSILCALLLTSIIDCCSNYAWIYLLALSILCYLISYKINEKIKTQSALIITTIAIMFLIQKNIATFLMIQTLFAFYGIHPIKKIHKDKNIKNHLLTFLISFTIAFLFTIFI